MSAVTTAPLGGARKGTAKDAVPMTTLVGVELRKMVDTRAGRWLLAGVGAIVVLVLGVVIATGDADSRSFTNLFAVAQLPMSILLPVLGVLAATSEWTQRTVLTTFSLVPSRGRVLTAKIGASVVLAVAAVVLTLIVSAIFAAIAPAVGDTQADWGLTASALLRGLVFQVLSMLMGVALGTLLLNSALAIVLFFVLPTIWSGLSDAISSLHDAQQWLDTGTTWMRLITPDDAMTGHFWAQAVATAGFWIALPMALGLWRVLRREVD